MPVIRRPDRDSGYWVYFRFRGRRVRRRSPIQTRKGAEEFERQLLREFGDDLAFGRDPFSGPPPTLAEFAPRWLTEYVKLRNRPSTVREKTKCLSVHIVPTLGGFRLDALTTTHVDRLARQLTDQGRSPKTVNNVLSVLHTCLCTARRWRLIREVPEFQWLRVPASDFRFLNETEEQSLVDACTAEFWQPFVLLILHTGVRFSEAAALTWSDLDVERPEPVVRIVKGGAEGRPGPTKTGAHREVPLDPVVLAALAGLPRVSDLVFPTPSGRMMNPASKLKYLHRFCERARIRPCGWHALRHTFASRLAANGVPLPVVQKLLGHTTLEMTMRYVHVDPRTMRAAARVVLAVMAAPRTLVPQVSPDDQHRPLLAGEQAARPLSQQENRP